MQQLLIPLLTLFISGVVLCICEIKKPLREIQYLSTFLTDIRELPIVLLFVVISTQISSYLSSLFVFPAIEAITHSTVTVLVLNLPLWLRVIIAILLKNFIAYFNHWLMHYNSFLWRSHKWHHLQKPMYWLKGNKDSLVYNIIFSWDLLFFSLLEVPLNATLIFTIAYSFSNFMVHANIQWSSHWMKKIEWVLVTPRYHLSHHSRNIQLHGKNLGDIFTFHDRIFGTYIDPDNFDFSYDEFGLDEEELPTVRMIIGI
jgi:sterol desaturase/sphingolipid hydroxylase (fatty acid hydroxylase superfamily)